MGYLVAKGAASAGLESRKGRVFGGILGCLAWWHTRGARVPEHAARSRLGTGYEVSTKSFRSVDLQRIC